MRAIVGMVSVWALLVGCTQLETERLYHCEGDSDCSAGWVCKPLQREKTTSVCVKGGTDLGWMAQGADANSDQSTDSSIEADQSADTSVQGYCTNASDTTILDGVSTSLNAEVSSCVLPCLNETPEGAVVCVEPCLANKFELSIDCTHCIALDAACAIENCRDICLSMGVDSSECLACRDQNGCTSAFESCTGRERP